MVWSDGNEISTWINDKEKFRLHYKIFNHHLPKSYVAVITQMWAKPYSNGLVVYKGPYIQENA